jgi:hypothetical protein
MRQLTRERDPLAVEVEEGEGWSLFSELRRLSEADCGKERGDSPDCSQKHGSRQEPVERKPSQAPRHVPHLTHCHSEVRVETVADKICRRSTWSQYLDARKYVGETHVYSLGRALRRE